MPGIIVIDKTRKLAWKRTLSPKAPGLALVAAILNAIVPLAVHAGSAAFPAPEGEIILTIAGDIARTNEGDSAVFDEAMLAALPTATIQTTTVVTDGVR